MENEEDQAQPDQRMTVGRKLRKAREAEGLSRADIASRTKIAERHLVAIEEDRFNDLAGRTYAVGFTRAYGRALGMDEKALAQDVRDQLDADTEPHHEMATSFEPGDPARVPPLRLAWIMGVGVIVVLGLLFAFWGNYLSPEGELPDLLSPRSEESAAPAPAPVVTATPTAAPTGPVVLTAKSDPVWMEVTDADGARLVQTSLGAGDSWTVPEGAKGPQLRTGRPDGLTITVGGREVAALADRPMTVSGVSLAPADLLAERGSQGASPDGAVSTDSE